MTKLVTEAGSPSIAPLSHQFPVLEAGNISYPNGRYEVAFEPGEDRASFTIRHRIECAPMISRLLEEGKALYVCAVSSPISSYRRTHVSRVASQQVRWNEKDLGEPPLFTPMIVSASSLELVVTEAQDGVHRIWDRKRIVLKKGSRLARGHVVQLRSSILNLLSLHEKNELGDGEIQVDALTEQGFQFLVNLSSDLHKFLQAPRKHGIREHILTHIVSACLSLLQREFSDDSDDEGGWASHRNLCAFADHLKSKGLPHWSDEEFRPDWVATKLHPHRIPKEFESDER